MSNVNLFAATLDELAAGIDTVWILVGAALVFFMQAGFAIVEAGLTRAKNTGNILMKNLMDFCLGTIVFWVLGYGLMHGNDIAGIIGVPTLGFITGEYDMLHLIFQTVFCATAATIVSGAMAERTKFSCYCIYSIVISLIVYPVSGHWIWGGGWLADLGFHDFAGSAAVHLVGGVSALIGAAILGPRIGKYGKDGKPRAIPGHNLTFAALGVFILWFCWFGFNGSSTYGVIGQTSTMATVFVTTNMAPAVAATACLIITWIRYKKPDVSMCLNGALAGLVAITASCDVVSPLGAFLIGIIAGFVVVFGVEFLDKVAKIDDPVGAIAVHCFCGASGTILTGIFNINDGIWGAIAGNCSWAAAFGYLGVQILGVVAVVAWVGATMLLTFFLLKKFMGLRVSAKEEIGGLDLYEHNLVSAYAGFDFVDHTADEYIAENAVYEDSFSDSSTVTSVPAAAKVPAATKSVETRTYDKPKLTKVVIVLNRNKFEALKAAMNGIGVTGMTVSEVMGCGVQKGYTAMYRGTKYEMNLLPKYKVEIVVSAVPVEKVISAAEAALHTGNIGDGKIFVYDVENVVKIRTGEQGFDALQDNEEA